MTFETTSLQATRTLRCLLSAGSSGFTEEKPLSSRAAAPMGSPDFLSTDPQKRFQPVKAMAWMGKGTDRQIPPRCILSTIYSDTVVISSAKDT